MRKGNLPPPLTHTLLSLGLQRDEECAGLLVEGHNRTNSLPSPHSREEGHNRTNSLPSPHTSQFGATEKLRVCWIAGGGTQQN